MTHGFHRGLDYSFTRFSAGAGRVIRHVTAVPDPSARPGPAAVGGSMSLYRAGLKLAFFLPLGVAMPLSTWWRTASGFTDVSPVV